MDRVEPLEANENSLDYHWRRADQELKFAEQCKDVAARRAHLQLAERHQAQCHTKI